MSAEQYAPIGFHLGGQAKTSHERRKPGAREIGCGRQAVMAGADYDRVILFPRHVLIALWTCAVKAFSIRMTVSQTDVSLTVDSTRREESQ